MVEEPGVVDVLGAALDQYDGTALADARLTSCKDPAACDIFPAQGVGEPAPALLEYEMVNATNASHHFPMFNFSQRELDMILADMRRGGYLDGTTELVFIVCYVSLMVCGVVGNVMVGWVIWRKRSMRTPRNLYIINLTLSDLSMCVVCMPFTLVGLLQKNWVMGNLVCKLVPVLQGANIMVSTSTVVAIAVDRYATIVKVGRSTRSHLHVAASVAAIWASSVFFTLPLYFYYFVTPVKLDHIMLYSRCVIHWPSKIVRNVWTIALLLTQYSIPIVVLSVVHGRIKRYLGRHMMGQYDARRAIKEIERNRKTTILLSTIAVAFAVCWLPFHVVNLLADFEYEGLRQARYFYTVFGAVHLMAMSSASINPVLYGWLNTNLRRELLEVLPPVFIKAGCCVIPEVLRRREGGAESQTRQPESVTLLVFQANPTNTIETVAHPPQTTNATADTTFAKDDT